MTAGPRKPELYVTDDGRLRVTIDESTLFGKITLAMANGWSKDGLRLLFNQMDVTADFWRETTIKDRAETLERLKDALWLTAAQDRLMMVAVGRPRWGAIQVDFPEYLLPPVEDRWEFPAGTQRATISLRAYAMPVITDLNI